MMRRRLISLALTLCLLASACFVAPAARAEGTKIYVVANTLKVYKTASTSGAKLTTLAYGQSVTQLSATDLWARVKTDSGEKGYCQLEGVSETNPNTMNVSARVNTANAPLYKKPSKSSAVWKKLKKDSVHTAVAITRDNQWVRLKSGKGYGYMEAKYLTTTSASTASPAPSPTPNPTAAPSGKVYVVATVLKVYAKASDTSKKVGSACYGQSLTCLETGNGFARVKLNSGKSGYCPLSGISMTNPNNLSKKVKITKANAPVYKKPSTGAAVWVKLRKNSSYTAVAVTPDGKWARIKNGSNYGYILAKYTSLSAAPPTPAPSTDPNAATVYVAANTTVLRKKASASAKALATLGYGQSGTLLNTRGSWAKLSAGGVTGYCTASDLSTKDPNVYAQTVYINADNAPIYRVPLTSAAVWTKLKRNDSFTAVAVTTDGKWFRLKNGENYGYIQSKYISTSKIEDSETAYVIKLSLPVYKKASESAAKLGTLYLGQSVGLIGASDGWAKVIAANGTTGYCLSGSLSSKDPNTLNRPYYAKEASVKLYSTPSTGAKVVQTAARNASLMVVCISPNEKWGRVALGSGGFAYAEMGKLSAEKIEDDTLIADIDPVTVYVVPDTLSVYAAASSASKSLGTMSFGESMTCTGRSAAWARVVNSVGTVGYCDSKSVTTKNPNTYNTALYAQAEGAKVYKKPKTSATALSTLTLNEKVTAVAYSEDRSWYRVKDGSGFGYVQASLFATTKIKDESQSSTIGKVIAMAKSYLGVPYVYTGQSPKGFDCSGLVYYVFKNAAGITLKRTAYAQGYDDSYKKISNKVNLKTGDLLFFNTVDDDDKCDHVGIYLGSNQFIHASSGGGKVMISNLGTNDSSYYFRTYSWARRIIS